MTKETADTPQVPKVVGAEIAISDDVDYTYGLPAEVAQAVTAQVLAALEERAIDPESVMFSGYDNSDEEGHARKSEGDFAHSGGSNRHEYFFGGVQDLPDGEEGPLAYAASGDGPVLGVYDTARLTELGLTDVGSVTATAGEILSAQVLEFLPTYVRPDES